MPCRYHSGSWLRRPQRIYLPGARRRALATCAQGPRGHSSRSLTTTRQPINPPSGYLSRRHGPGMPAAASAGTAVSWHAACLVHVVSWAHVPLAPPGGWLACGLQPGVVLYVPLELGNHLLGQGAAGLRDPAQDIRGQGEFLSALEHDPLEHQLRGDRKSTRVNSSHPSISYAVFCLKKKKKGHGDREAGCGKRETRCGDAGGGLATRARLVRVRLRVLPPL